MCPVPSPGQLERLMMVLLVVVVDVAVWCTLYHLKIVELVSGDSCCCCCYLRQQMQMH